MNMTYDDLSEWCEIHDAPKRICDGCAYAAEKKFAVEFPLLRKFAKLHALGEVVQIFHYHSEEYPAPITARGTTWWQCKECKQESQNENDIVHKENCEVSTVLNLTREIKL